MNNYLSYMVYQFRVNLAGIKGFYRVYQMDGGCNAVPEYEIASPVFPETVIHLDGREGRGDKFVIKANGASRKNIYVVKPAKAPLRDHRES